MSDDAGIKYEYRATGALRGSLFPSNDMAGPTRSTPKGADTAAWTSGLTPYGMQRRPVGDWESFEWDDDAEGEESDD